MNLLQRIQKYVGDQGSQVGALLAFKEYMVSLRNKVTAWSGAATTQELQQSIQVVIPTEIDDVIQDVVAYVDGNVYNAAIDDEDGEVSVRINEHDFLTVPSATVLNAVEETISGVIVQSEFVDYTLNNENVSKAGFCSYITGLYNNLSADIVNSFGEYLKSGDALQGLRTFLGSVSVNKFTKKQGPTDEYIQVTDYYAYTGQNVYVYALEKAWNTITGFFNVVWEGITKIGKFLQSILDGIVNLAKWLIKLAFRQLTTRYEKISDRLGMVDYPLFQFDFGEIDYDLLSTLTPDNVIDTMCESNLKRIVKTNGLSNLIGNAGDCYWAYSNNYVSMTSLKFDRLKQLVGIAVHEYIDGTWYARPIVQYLRGPSTDSNDSNEISFALVFGVSSDKHLIMQLFPLLAFGSVSSMNDKEIYRLFKYCSDGAFQSMVENGAYPCLFSPTASFSDYLNQISDLIQFWHGWITKPILNDDPDDNFDLAGHCPFSNVDYDYDANMNSYQKQLLSKVILGFIGNSCMTGAIHDVLSKDAQWSKYFYLLGLLYVPSGLTYVWSPIVPHTLNDNIPVGSSLIDPSEPDDWITYSYLSDLPWRMEDDYGFIPYSASDFPISAIHYQSIDEAATEVLTTIVVALIIAAAIFITIKYVKFRKQRIAKQEIAQGYVDNMAWNLPQNPSTDQLNAYIKAKRKAKRISKVNSILGLNPIGKQNSDLSSTVESVHDAILALQGKNPSSAQQPTSTIQDVMRIIRGN